MSSGRKHLGQWEESGPSVAEMPREEDKASSQRPQGDMEFGFGSDESYWRGAGKNTNPSFPYLLSTLAVVCVRNPKGEEETGDLFRGTLWPSE